MERYIYEGKGYNVPLELLEEFLHTHSGAKKYDEVGNINGSTDATPIGGPITMESSEPSHISLSDLKKASISGDGEEPTWKDELFHSEENVFENLKEFYKEQPITFKEARFKIDF